MAAIIGWPSTANPTDDGTVSRNTNPSERLKVRRNSSMSPVAALREIDGHAEQSQRQLHEAERVEQPAHRSVHHVAGLVQNAGGEGGIYKHVNLHGGVAQDSRPHQRENMAQAWMRPI